LAQNSVLILDDEPEMLDSCRRILSRSGYRCIGTSDPKEAIALVRSDHPDLVLTDLKMPGMDGLEVLHCAREVDSDVAVIVFTAFATIPSAVAAVKQGAFDFIAKPFSMDELKLAVERALEHRRLALENRNMRDQLQGVLGFENIIGRSPALMEALKLVRRAARSESDIVILGESGTGKELIARAIHANSRRCVEPFVAVDCASLPENLLESELFGHEKGAFTGALKAKAGLIETANRGTLFLDEVAELPPSLQVKLLRTLQERQIRRVGGVQETRVDIRVVSATNRNLDELIRNGRFREDLYYRLNVITIKMPPLRERSGDVTLLARDFLKKQRINDGFHVHGFRPEVLRTLEAYSWPGNVRELRNVIERACALAEGELIGLNHLPDQLRYASVRTDGGTAIDDAVPACSLKSAKDRWLSNFEPTYIDNLLKEHRGNVSQVARVAGIDRKTLYRLIKKYHLR
jgi:two-component system, NtrC family, response regulator HydG